MHHSSLLLLNDGRSFTVMFSGLLQQASRRPQRSSGVSNTERVLQHLIGAMLRVQNRHLSSSWDAVIKAEHGCGVTITFEVRRFFCRVACRPLLKDLEDCRNDHKDRLPLLVVPASSFRTALALAAAHHLQDNVSIMSAEAYLTQSVLLLAFRHKGNWLNVLKSLIHEYNRRMVDIAKDPSLMIKII